MSKRTNFVHPYMPSSDPKREQPLLDTVGVSDASELYNVIPENLRLHRSLDLPKPLLSEQALERHIEDLFSKNTSCKKNLNFLGAGCWQHYVPKICDEIANRAEFKTAYCGDTYSDKGKYQAMFEYTSMLGELLGYDLVSCPVYDWCCAMSSAILMAGRITNRSKVLVASTAGEERLSHIHNFCRAKMQIEKVKYDPETGLMDLEDLKVKMTEKVACVYFENPSYLGFIEVNANKICDIAHEKGALTVAGIDPISLGVLEAPALYGVDIAVGDAQPLGNHMNCGGGMCGFIASCDDSLYLNEYPNFLFALVPTGKEGEFGFGQCTHDRTSYVTRDSATDYIGTTAWLAGITASVYMALMGPQGIKEVGETIMQRREYAQQLLDTVKGVDARRFSAPSFKEFVVDFNGTGKTVKDINAALLQKGIFGGKDLSGEYPELGQCALYCVTEIHSAEDIERLYKAMEEVVR